MLQASMRRRKKKTRVRNAKNHETFSLPDQNPAVESECPGSGRDKIEQPMTSLTDLRVEDESTMEGYDTGNYRQLQSSNSSDFSSGQNIADSTDDALSQNHNEILASPCDVRDKKQNESTHGKKEETKNGGEQQKARKRGRPPKVRTSNLQNRDGSPNKSKTEIENLYVKRCFDQTSEFLKKPGNVQCQSEETHPDDLPWSPKSVVSQQPMTNDSTRKVVNPTNEAEDGDSDGSPRMSTLQYRKQSHTLSENLGIFNSKQNTSVPVSKKNKENNIDENSGNVISVVCGPNHGLMYLSRLSLATGERCKTKCIHFDDRWWTPSEFQMTSGRGAAKDWKRTIRHGDKCLKALLESGTLKLNLCNKNACFCDPCNNRNTTSFHTSSLAIGDVAKVSNPTTQSGAGREDTTVEEDKSTNISLTNKSVEDAKKDRKRSKDSRIEKNCTQKKMRLSDGRKTEQTLGNPSEVVTRRGDDYRTTDFMNLMSGVVQSQTRADECQRKSIFNSNQPHSTEVPLFCQPSLQSHLIKIKESSTDRNDVLDRFEVFQDYFYPVGRFKNQELVRANHDDLQSRRLIFDHHDLYHSSTDLTTREQSLQLKNQPMFSSGSGHFSCSPRSAEFADHLSWEYDQASSTTGDSGSSPKTLLRAVVEELKRKKKSLRVTQTKSDQPSKSSLPTDMNDNIYTNDSAIDLSKSLNGTNELDKLLPNSRSLPSSTDSRSISPNKWNVDLSSKSPSTFKPSSPSSNPFASQSFLNNLAPPLFSPPFQNHHLNFTHHLQFYSPYIFMGFPLHPLISPTQLISPSSSSQNSFPPDFQTYSAGFDKSQSSVKVAKPTSDNCTKNSLKKHDNEGLPPYYPFLSSSLFQRDNDRNGSCHGNAVTSHSFRDHLPMNSSKINKANLQNLASPTLVECLTKQLEKDKLEESFVTAKEKKVLSEDCNETSSVLDFSLKSKKISTAPNLSQQDYQVLDLSKK